MTFIKNKTKQIPKVIRYVLSCIKIKFTGTETNIENQKLK